jgi:hypothetical protein
MLLLILAAPQLWAQRVTGELVTVESATGVAGAVVTLLDEAGRTVAGTLTDGDGRFVLAAPVSGRYRLRAERIGLESTLSPFLALAAGSTVEQRLVISTAAVELEGITARGTQRCQARPDSGAEMHRVWEEARKALSAVALTENLRFARFEIRTYERDLDRSGRVLAERSTAREVLNDYPFRSAPAADLMQGGFVQQVGDSIVYHGPDAHVLLSDEFLDGHCFSLRRAANRPGMIGLAFEPMARRSHIPGVAGVLWLDESAAELRQMEYRYTRFPPARGGRFAPASDPSGFGGTLEFNRLENGAWIVSAWKLLVPSRQVLRESRGGAGAVARETGGEVAAIAQPGSARRLAVSDGGILGRVIDADDRSAVQGAVVYLSGTQHTVRTGPAGEFRLTDLREGRYLLAVYHPGRELDPALLPGLEIDVRAGEDESVEVLLPGLTAQLARRCEGQGTRGGALLAGLVRDEGSGIALPGAVVELRRPTAGGPVRRAVADAEGRYHFCDVERGPAFVLRATLAARGSAERELTLLPDGNTRSDLAIDLRTPIRLTGRVLDAETGRPVSAARVRIAGTAAAALTDAQGRFLIENAPTGTQNMEVEHLGYGTHREAVALRGAETVDLIIHLGIRAIEIRGVVATATVRPPPGLEDFHRRKAEQRGGHFFDRSAIERRNATRVEHLLAEYGFVVNNFGVITPRGMSGFSTCGPMVYIDGIRVTHPGIDPSKQDAAVSPGDARDALRMVNPALLDGIEIYRGASQVPVELGGTGGGCGVVMLWTRRGA